MTDSTDMSDIVECSVCVEDVSLSRILVIENAPVCHTCVRQIFINATEDESNYPPRWADKELKPDSYLDVLGPELVKQYRKKLHEYKKKWDDRVYCPTLTEQPGGKCGEYLGGSRDRNKHIRLTLKCKKCSKKTCLACKAQPTSRSGHVCEATAEEQEQEAASFQGLVKGKDYQKCPNCKRKLELRDGCNHVVCPCGTSLCFVCGQPASSNSNHWGRTDSGQSTCPRYKQPNDRSPGWDGGPLGPRGPVAPINFPDMRAFDRQITDVHERRRHERRNAVAGLQAPPFEPVSTPAATAAGTTARERRSGNVTIHNNPINLDAPAARQFPRRPPRSGNENAAATFSGHARMANHPLLGQHADQDEIPLPSRSTFLGRLFGRWLEQPDVLMDEQEETMMQDSIFEHPDPTARSEFLAPAQINNDSATPVTDPSWSFHPHFEAHPTQDHFHHRADPLAQLLSSLPAGEENDHFTVVPRQRIPAPQRATVFQAPEIPERFSSLQPRMARMQRERRSARRQTSLNVDFPAPPRQDGNHGVSENSMMLDQ